MILTVKSRQPVKPGENLKGYGAFLETAWKTPGASLSQRLAGVEAGKNCQTSLT